MLLRIDGPILTDCLCLQKLTDHLKRYIPIGRFRVGSLGSLMLKPLEEHQVRVTVYLDLFRSFVMGLFLANVGCCMVLQGIPEMIGYCLKDEGLSHFQVDVKGFTTEELNAGRSSYNTVSSTYLLGKSKITKANITLL